jgi:CO/xanthine dehydrogenase Mo-binding subunit
VRKVAGKTITTLEGLGTAAKPDPVPKAFIDEGAAQIRQAAATARGALVVRAAERLGLATDSLEVKNGVIRSRWDRTVSVGYPELVGGEDLRLKVDKNVPLKKPADYTIVGKSVPRVDGARIRTVPFTPARVKAALAKA